jgi:F-type H+-transporting ATPase subunit gamma
MPGTKEIRVKIKSVQNTRKITKAMEMVAASKMRKAQERMRHARPYAEKIRNVAAHISHANPEYKHPALVERDTVKRMAIILVSTDKGLCGALNTNLARLVLGEYKEWQAQGEEIEVCALGNKGLGFMQRLGAKIVSQLTQLGDRPQVDKLIGPIKVVTDAFMAGHTDRVMIAYNRFPASGSARRSRHGITFTSPMRRWCSTRCCDAMSRSSFCRLLPKTWRPSSRRAWWR